MFVNGFGSTGKGDDLNIETFVCDGSDNGVACNWFEYVTNYLYCNVQLCRYFENLNYNFGLS